MKIRYSSLAIWLLFYFLLTLLPMGAALVFDRPEPRGFLVEFGSLLGLLGLGVLAMQFVISGRHPWFASGVGQDNLLQFHRQMGLFAWLLVLAHPTTLMLADPQFMDYLNPSDQTLRAISLSAVVIATTVLIVSSLWRVTFKLQYEWWRALHGILSLFIVSAGLGHGLLVDHYTAGWPVKIALCVLIGIAVLLLIESRLLRPLRMKRKAWKVSDVEVVDGDATRFLLKADKHQGMTFMPGQYVWITLHHTPFSLQQHPFSIHSDANNPTHLQFTAKHVGDFTKSLKHTEVGSSAWVEGPYGVFTMDVQSKRDAVLFAGGVGITPIIGMLRSCVSEASDKSLTLFYANPDRDSVLFWNELNELSSQLNLKVIHVLEDAPDNWEGETGLIDAKLLERYLHTATADSDYYICGPAPLMNSVESFLREKQIPLKSIYSERFDLV
ncbi:ferredoxin reductase family protein [Aliidiomarina indica]|uniref:ferredoxin reductase family protein n=1 Tax=Aliidiomarina indica TaxID=2749147 RepID=UPI00188FA348|nr:ferric reductase-like transmembrane domain-containing protein [Aliidiomarina indica]